jgi:hypothetical protein
VVAEPIEVERFLVHLDVPRPLGAQHTVELAREPYDARRLRIMRVQHEDSSFSPPRLSARWLRRQQEQGEDHETASGASHTDP